jgi:hypothetical protein
MDLNENDTKERTKKHAGWSLFLGGFAVCLVPLFFMGTASLLANFGTPAIPLTGLLLGGVLALIITLTLVAYTFWTLDLHDRAQALGLPEGSIRAVIALILILIFIISSMFMFGRLASPDVITVSGLTEEQVASLGGNDIISKVPDSREPALDPATGKPDGVRLKPQTYTVKRFLGTHARR